MGSKYKHLDKEYLVENGENDTVPHLPPGSPTHVTVQGTPVRATGDGHGIYMNNPPPINEGTIIPPPEGLDKSRPGFAETKVFKLSLLQICLGALAMILGITVLVTRTWTTGAGIFSGLFFCVTGIVGQSAARKKTNCTIVAYLVLNILAIILFAMTLITTAAIGITRDTRVMQVYDDDGVTTVGSVTNNTIESTSNTPITISHDFTTNPMSTTTHHWHFVRQNYPYRMVQHAILMLCGVLHFIMCILGSVFSGRAVCGKNANRPKIVYYVPVQKQQEMTDMSTA
ncbi:unnamed protein product [Owenia fusiformis]|uniref:Uncharacterized protein n=1 Tax=Owenia fusiformis TaxID=6347 RepID=A0A8J1UKQ1_OWEFU|nr:unnamed protein product [Owenia fusiformis]